MTNSTIAAARIAGPGAWRRGDLRPEDYRVALSPASLDEIRRAADELREYALPTIVRQPDEFDMPACRAAMGGVRRMLDSGVRFAIDNEGAAAMAALLDLFDDDTLSADFDLEPGQLQFVDNRVLGHARTDFEDYPAPNRRRHLVRLWLRDRGRRAYQG